MIQRTIYLTKIEQALKTNPIIALIGARQVGKTSLMNMINVSGAKLFLNGQNPEISEIFQSFSTLEKYLQINLHKQLEATLFIDEFQFISGVSTMMKLLTDKYNKLKIIVSGSSSIDIHQQVKESLAGRIRIIPVYSLSFEEYILFNNKQLYEKYLQYSIEDNPKIIDKQIQLLLNEYLIYGGLPKIALTTQYEEKIKLLQDILQTYLLRDVRSYIRNEDFTGFNKMLQLLAAQIGNQVNINELSKLSKISYRKCEEYISLLEQMYILKLISPFSTNKRKEITKMKKVYFYDLGMRNMIYNSFNDIDIRVDKGAVFENFTFLELSKHLMLSEIKYYRTKDGLEVDFIVNDFFKIIPVEVKYKDFEKAQSLKNINDFEKIQSFENAYIINLTNNKKTGNQNYIPAYFISKLKNIFGKKFS
ncbi:MAG: ATP-binding protein [Bacteroidales bacterium]|nr:ATP-binding protein [Bacteroidales bacterium]